MWSAVVAMRVQRGPEIWQRLPSRRIMRREVVGQSAGMWRCWQVGQRGVRVGVPQSRQGRLGMGATRGVRA